MREGGMREEGREGGMREEGKKEGKSLIMTCFHLVSPIPACTEEIQSE